MGHKRSKKTSNYNQKKNINSANISADDMRSLKLLNIQRSVLILDLYSIILSYKATLEGIQVIQSRYDETITSVPNPDVTALQSVSLGLVLNIVFAKVGFSRYSILYRKYIDHEIEYSLEPNESINISNILGILSSYYALNGAIGIYTRDNNQHVIGIR